MTHFSFATRMVGSLTLALAAIALAAPVGQLQAAKPAIVTGYGNLPLIFEANQGQTDERVKFLSRGPGYRLFLTESEAVLSLGGESTLRVRLEGAAPAPKMTGLDRLPGISNYFIGRDRSKWRTGVPHYAKVGYEGVYPGIDLVFYGTRQRQLEYDFVVAPGADPGAIALAFEGAERLEIDDSGDLIAHLPGGEVRFLKPVIYQEADGAKQPVAGGYALKDGRVTFEVASYDPAKPLVIDPVLEYPVLEYSTYLGGTDIEEGVRGIAVDGDGNAYIAGRTRSADFPIVEGFQDTCVISEGFSDCHTAFVAKLDATGSNLLYSTYLGGASIETAWGIAVDASGNAYVAGGIDQGSIKTDDFPTTLGAFQESAISVDDAFFVKLNATGSELLYSTYLGGSRGDIAWDIAVDSMGRAVIGGDTSSANFFPTTQNAFRTECPLHPEVADLCATGEAFLVVIDPAGGGASDLAYGTFLGGDGDDRIFGVAVDGAGLAYLTGLTGSSDFPTSAGALQEVRPGDGISAFLTVINPGNDGAEGLIYSTYLGGNDGGTIGRDVDIEPGCVSPCRAYLTGTVGSDTFPTTPNAVVPFPVAGFGTFVTIIDPDPLTEDLEYSTYFGGNGGWGIAAGPDGKAFVTGQVTGSIPTRDAIQDENLGHGDAFVAVIDPFAEIDPFGNNLNTGLLFATYLGGTSTESAPAIAVDVSGSAYLAGTTWSQDFPTTAGAFQPELRLAEATKKKGPFGGGEPVVRPDAVVAKIGGPFLGEGPVDPLSLSAKPVARADFYSTNEEETLNVAAPGVLENDTDFDSTELIVTGHGVADNGTVIVNSDGSFTYTPDAGFSGADSFTYTISDGQASDSALVTIDVAPVNDPPVARNDTYFGAVAEVPFTVPAPGVLRNDEDPEGDALTAVLSSPTENGSLNLMSDGGFTYTAKSRFSGTDSFTYKASDGTLESESFTVALNVAAGDVHVGDLVLSVGGNLFRGRRKSESSWSVAVYVNLHDSYENPVVDATVSSAWLGASGTETQVTDCVTEFTFFTTSGEQRDGAWCRVYIEGISTDIESVTFNVTDVTHDSLPYFPGLNHDFDGDSDGTRITANAPSL